MKAQFLMLSAQEFSMEDEKTKKVNEGISVQYIPTDNLDPTGNESTNGGFAVGKKVAKSVISKDKRYKIVNMPGMYEVTLEMATVSNKVVMQMKDLDYKGPVELKVIIPPGAGKN